MKRSLIQEHTSELIKGLIGKSQALRTLDQTTVKGQLRELFISKVLSKFLSRQFSTGNGVIINQAGKMSKQIDIIIYDTRILPPLIEEQNLGVYPVESVLAAIEVRSRVDKSTIQKYAKSVAELYDEVYDPDWSIYHDYSKYLPFYCLVGFCEEELFKGKDSNEIWSWMANNAKPIAIMVNQNLESKSLHHDRLAVCKI